MADDADSSLPVIAVTAAVGAVVLLIVLLCSIGRGDGKKKKEEVTNTNEAPSAKVDRPVRKSKFVPKGIKKAFFTSFTHPWLASTLKGHSGNVVSLDFSPNGKYIVTASEDRALMLWSTKELLQKEHKFIRINVELDSVSNIKFSPDSRAMVGSLLNSNKMRIFKMGKKDDGSTNVGVTGTSDFPKPAPEAIISIGVSSKGTFIMAGLSGTQIIIYDLKGEVQETINTHQMHNYYCLVSPCGRFVASAGFTPDVKIWEVVGASGDVKVIRAMELKGHTSGVSCFSFNGDSSRVATVSKDGTWKLWDVEVRYSQGQDAKLLFSGPVCLEGPNLIALSPDGRTVAVSGDDSVVFWDAISLKQQAIVEKIHSGPITALSFDNTSHYLVTCGDKHVQVIHNVPGYEAAIAELRQKEKKASSAGMRERIRQEIEEAKETLTKIHDKNCQEAKESIIN